MSRIRKGDTVYVLSGKDKGKTGKVLQVFQDDDKALVENINMLKHFDRPTKQSQTGGVVDREAPIHLCKLALVSPKTMKPTRVGWRTAENGSKVRFCRRTGDSLDNK